MPKNLEEYLALFNPATARQLTGEASAWYLWSRTAADEIADLSPAARIIAIVREPADFLRSLHLQLVQDHVEPENDLRRVITLESGRRQGQSPKTPAAPRDWPQVLPAVDGLIYADYVRYVEQLRRFDRRFPAENLLVLVYDDFRRDNEGTIRRVLEFLGLGDGAALDVPEETPASESARDG